MKLNCDLFVVQHLPTSREKANLHATSQQIRILDGKSQHGPLLQRLLAIAATPHVDSQ